MKKLNVYYEMINLLLKDTRLDINIQNKKGHNALGLAASFKLYLVVEKLLEHKNINLNTLNTAAKLAKKHNAQDIVKKIEKHKKATEDLKVVKKLLNKITIESKENQYVNVLLRIPIIGDTIKAIRYLFRTNIDRRYTNGDTALMAAASIGHKDIIKILEKDNLEKGVNDNINELNVTLVTGVSSIQNHKT